MKWIGKFGRWVSGKGKNIETAKFTVDDLSPSAWMCSDEYDPQPSEIVAKRLGVSGKEHTVECICGRRITKLTNEIARCRHCDARVE